MATPVISVGNLSTGGSGKTILVQALIEYFKDLQKIPSVLSRGYGRSSKGLFLVSDKSRLKGDPFTAGDEAFLIAKNHPGVPVVVAEDRVIGARYLQDHFSPDVIILDDGFQHRRLHRDLNILLLDQPGDQVGHLLPWGKFREPFSGLDRADLTLFSKAGRQKSSNLNLHFDLAENVVDQAGNKHALSSLKGSFGLFAGLGNPHHFFESVQQHHRSAKARIIFSDHTLYGPKQLDQISRISCAYWITTQKDFIKLEPGFCQAQNIYFIHVKTALPSPLIALLKQNFN